MGVHGFSQEDVEASLDELDRTLARMEEALENGPWLMEQDFTLADIVVMPAIDRLADLGLATMWEDHFPGVTQWYARLRARPSFAKAYAPGSRLSEGMKIRPLAWA
jgi:glutathione S-transferase